MGTNVSNFQNNAKNSNIILTSESNEMEFSKEVKTVSSFKNSDFGELKIIIIDEEPYFIGSPIASFLGYTNPRKAIRDHVDEDDRLIMKVPDTQGWNETFRPYTPNTKILIINESGLYSLIFGSKMDFAKKFKKWVTSEVLPSIRKTGSYSITPKDYPSALRALADEIDAKNRAIAERAQAEAERQQAIKTIEEQRPDVEFAESFKKVDHENMWLIRDVAKKLEQNGIIIAEKNLRLFLEEVKFMFRNGQVFNNPKYLESAQKRLGCLQRRMSRKKEGSNRYKKAKHDVAVCHERIRNRRQDLLHKVSKKIVSENQAIIIEDLNVKGMLKNHCLAKGIASASWSEFFRMLQYKSDWRGVNLIRIGRFEPSSKMCGCGYIHRDLKLSDRIWTCPECGAVNDRDLLAANNIKKFGLEKQNLLTQENINKTPVVNWEGDVELSAVAGAVKRQNVLV